MKTELLGSTPEQIEKAAQILKDGGLVGIPTETVYGLAANALDGAAVAKIFEAKGRPMDNPLIVHVADFNDIESFNLVSEIPGSARLLAKRFWPGPLTMIMKKGKAVPDEVSAGLDTVAIRFPSHPVAKAIIRAAQLPLAAPSANLSGSPSPTTARHVMNDLDGKIEAVLDGGEREVGLESTVITLADGVPRVLRPGGVLLNFDADYGAVDFTEIARAEGAHAHAGIEQELLQEGEDIRRLLPLSAEPRPQWDVQALDRAGFASVALDQQISARVFRVRDASYNPVPMFALRAIK